MRVLIVLLILLLSFFLLGCLEQKKNNTPKGEEQIPDQSLVQILANNSSVDEIREAVVETLEKNSSDNNSISGGS